MDATEKIVLSHKVIGAGCVIGGLLLVLLAAYMDSVMMRHKVALAAGILGALLLVFAVGYHVLMPRQRGHRHHDRPPPP